MSHALFILLLFACTQRTLLQVQVVAMSEFVCGRNAASSGLTTIRFPGGKPKAVAFGVTFRRVGEKCTSQRCTLLTWRSVRQLEDFLRGYPLEKLEHGLIQVDNSLLQPGVEYLLNITTISDNKSETSQLSLNYVNEALSGPKASVSLLGPLTSFAFNPITFHAETSYCGNVPSYSYKWQVSDADNAKVFDFPEKSDQLTIDGNTFQAMRTYKVEVRLMDGDTVLAERGATIRIAAKGVRLRLSIKSLTTRLNQPVKVAAFVTDYDNLGGEHRLAWSCKDLQRQEACLFSVGPGEISASFGQEGQYEIGAEAGEGPAAAAASCLVNVLQDAPTAEVDVTELPVRPSAGVAVRAGVYNLRTLCTLQWSAPDVPPYQPIDLKTIPGQLDRVINITNRGDLFLHELEEYSNETLNTTHDLVIPGSGGTWQGLKGDATYLFRLTVRCPSSDLNSYDESELVEPVLPLAIVKTDVVLKTSAPPKIANFAVRPSEGRAFDDEFVFGVEENVGLLTYKFGYRFNEKDVIARSLTGVSSCKVSLPYNKSGLETFVEVCDCFESCARAAGPLVQTTLPDPFSDALKTFLIGDFHNKLQNEDFFKGLSLASSLIPLDVFPEAVVLVHKGINDQLDYYLNNNTKLAGNFVKSLNYFGSDLRLGGETLKKLIELREKSSEAPEKYFQRKLLSDEKIEDGGSLIEVSELIIRISSDTQQIIDEKEKLVRQLHNYMGKLCRNLYEKRQPVQLDLQTLRLSVEKLPKSGFNTFYKFNHDSARFKLGKYYKNEIRGELCLGVGVFRDYFNKSGDFYMVDVLNGETNDVNEYNEIVVLLPIDAMRYNLSQCSVYNKQITDCKTELIEQFVKCSCKELGFYHVGYLIETSENKTESVSASVIITDSAGNKTQEETVAGNDKHLTLTIVAVSIIGLAALVCILQRISQEEDEEEEIGDGFDLPHYRHLHEDDYLTDAHI